MKKALLQKIIDQLVRELDIYAKAADASRFEATHEQSKAEGKYDTRGLEASYLAHAQSKQAAEVILAIKEFKALPVRRFTQADPIDLGALVELSGQGERSFYFIGPRAGGTEVIHQKKEVLVITPQSPLGQQLIGRKQGERLQLEIAGTRSRYEILSVT